MKYLLLVMALVLVLGTGLAMAQDAAINCPDGCSDCCKEIIWTGPSIVWDKVSGSGSTNCNGKLCIPVTVTAKVYSWGYIKLDYTNFEFSVYKPGHLGSFLTNICTLSNGYRYLEYPSVIWLKNPKDSIPFFLSILPCKPGAPVPAAETAFTAELTVPAVDTVSTNKIAIQPCCHEFWLFGKVNVSDDHQTPGFYKGGADICLTIHECDFNYVEMPTI